MCDCNDVFMVNFKLFLQNRSIYSKYLSVSKTCFAAYGNFYRREGDFRASGQPGSCIQPDCCC